MLDHSPGCHFSYYYHPKKFLYYHLIQPKDLSNFLRSLDLPLINLKVEFDLSWIKDCVLVQHNNNKTGIDFKITSTNFSVSVDILSINNSIKHGTRILKNNILEKIKI